MGRRVSRGQHYGPNRVTIQSVNLSFKVAGRRTEIAVLF